MKKVMYLLIFTLFFYSYEIKMQLMPRVVNLSIDLFAVTIALAILLRLIIARKATLEIWYIYLVGFYVLELGIGILLNLVQVEPLLIGMRSHLKYIPFFFLPMVYEFSDFEIKKQLRFILLFLFFQLPINLLQKFVLYRDMHPDFVTGTLGVGSHVSMVLICCIAILFAFYLKGGIGFKAFLGATIWLFLSTTLNETKSAIVFLLIAFFFPVYFMPRVWASAKIKNMFTVGVMAVLLLTTFGLLFQQAEGYDVFRVYEREMEGRGHLYTGRPGTSLGVREIGRLDALWLVITDHLKDPGALFFGLGCGNVISASDKAHGEYVSAKRRYQGEMLSLTHMLWELGLVGVFLYLCILYCVFRDALFLANASDLFGSLALGWTAIVPIISIGPIYKNIIWFSALYVLFWYFSGVIAGRAFRLRRLRNIKHAELTDYDVTLRRPWYEGLAYGAKGGSASYIKRDVPL